MAKKDKKGKKDKKKSKSSGDTGKQTKYSGSIALSKLTHVRMKKKNKKGKKIDCIVIPVKQNYLVEGKEGALYLPITVVTKEFRDEYDQNGFIGQSVSSEVWRAASDELKEEIKALPIIGNIKNWESSGGGNDASGSVSDEIDDDDDLPF